MPQEKVKMEKLTHEKIEAKLDEKLAEALISCARETVRVGSQELAIPAVASALEAANLSETSYIYLDSGGFQFDLVQPEKAVLIAIFRALTHGGFRLKVTTDFPESQMRAYTYVLRQETPLSSAVRVTVYVRFAADGGGCKYVQTGTKEVPVYAFECPKPADLPSDPIEDEIEEEIE